jgi:glycosyltransferase involved in cell wall biosynthesis
MMVSVAGERARSMATGPAVLQVLPALDAGGAERSAVDVAAALVRQGWRAVVASRGGRMQRELERAGAIHEALPVDSKNPLTMRNNIERIGTLIERYGVRIVHARSRAPAWSARAAARRHGIPFVTTFHGTYNDNWLKHGYNAIMVKGDRVIANSEFIAAHVRGNYGVPDGRLITIPRGIDLGRFDAARVTAQRMIQLAQSWRLPDSHHVLLLPGRLTRWKGQAVLIEAMAQLNRQDIVAVLVGDEQGRIGYRRELERLIARHGLEASVRLAGHCNDMPAAYALADVVISASTDPEAFGRIAAEAQAMGRPVIASDHGGARETVRAGETGWLVPPGDAGQLAAALRLALGMTPEERAAVAAAARAHIATQFDLRLMCARTLAVYAELIGEAPA